MAEGSDLDLFSDEEDSMRTDEGPSSSELAIQGRGNAAIRLKSFYAPQAQKRTPGSRQRWYEDPKTPTRSIVERSQRRVLPSSFEDIPGKICSKQF